MSMIIMAKLWAHILHLDHISALTAAFDGAVACCHKPEDLVSIGGNARAADVLFFTKGADYDWIVDGAFSMSFLAISQ